MADEAMDELRQAHLTEHLRRDLEPGRPCPICGQVVHTAPDIQLDDLDDVEAGVATLRRRAEQFATALGAAESRVRSAELHDATARTAAADAVARLRAAGGAVDDDQAALDALHAELATLEREQAMFAPRVEGLTSEVEREEGSLAEASRRLEADQAEVDELAGRLGPWAHRDDPVAALGAAVDQLQDAEQAMERWGRRTREAVDDVAGAEAALRRFEQERMGSLRQSLTVLATTLATRLPAPELHAPELLQTADELSDIALDQVAEADRTARRADERIGELSGEIAAVGAPVGVNDADQLAPRLRGAAGTLRSAQEALAQIEAASREAVRLAARSARERRVADLYGQVAIDLQANRFPRFLLSRFHERLALGATTRLLALSHGAFSFTGTEPDHLAVVDHRRNHRVRGAATLSGGERFLASLSLALALADIASGAEGRLECLFLDEGFSALDADSLELAIGGVEQMADDGRLVVIITHLPGVAERLGAAIHVRKDPAGASHIVDLGTRLRIVDDAR